MKYRKDFVTNSSSSSFVCEICGESESGYDLCLDDVGMCECVNYHVFCTEHMLPYESSLTREEMFDALVEASNRNSDIDLDVISGADLDEMREYYFKYIASDGGYYDVPEEVCPICQFVEYSDHDMAKYLEKKYGVSRDEVFAEIKKLNKRRQKLYDFEYIAEVCKRFDLEPAKIAAGWKDEFGTYKNFAKKVLR